jgi:hypothetical protein
MNSCLSYRHSGEITSRFVNNAWKKPVISAAALVVLSFCCSRVTAQDNQRTDSDPQPAPLSDIRLDDKALLVVLKSSVISAEETDRTIIEKVLKADAEPSVRHQMVYGTLAKKLNGYIRKYKSLSPAVDLSEADFVIFFSLIEYRQILNATYPFGELFVIAKGEPKIGRQPRIVWKSRKVLWAGDAIDDFLRDLKNMRGES